MHTSILRSFSRLRGLFRLGGANREFRDEVEAHIEPLTERFVRKGVPRTEEAYRTQRQFGNAALLEQRHREARASLWPSSVFQDVRYGMRMLRKSPAITAIAITSLAPASARTQRSSRGQGSPVGCPFGESSGATEVIGLCAR